MYILLTLVLLPAVVNFVSCESTKEPPKDVPPKTTLKSVVTEATPSVPVANISNIRSLWSYHPTPRQPQGWGEKDTRYRMLLRSPQSLTKLAKTLSIGFDPSFSKDYFEPFEKRPKPVTLIAFRKNGFVPRRIVKPLRSYQSGWQKRNKRRVWAVEGRLFDSQSINDDDKNISMRREIRLKSQNYSHPIMK